MDPNAAAPILTPAVEICSSCHQPVRPEYYFCPNCGNKLHQEPLKTDYFTQAWIYLFSIVLPMLCFLFVTRWPGFKYLRSQDERTRSIGFIACALLLVSTIITFYLSYVWIQQQIQSALDQVDQVDSGLGM